MYMNVYNYILLYIYIFAPSSYFPQLVVFISLSHRIIELLGDRVFVGNIEQKKIFHCFLQENDPQMLGVPHLFKVWFCFFSFVGKSCSEIGFAAIYLVRLKSAKFHVEVLRRPKITGP